MWLLFFMWWIHLFLDRYRWTKNGQPFDYEEEEGRISRQPHKGTLYVNKPLDGDEGVYQCFAENIHGVSVSNTVSLRRSGMYNSFFILFQLIHNRDVMNIWPLFCIQPFYHILSWLNALDIVLNTLHICQIHTLNI